VATKTWRSVRLEEDVAADLDAIATLLFDRFIRTKRDDVPGGKPQLPSTSAVVRELIRVWNKTDTHNNRDRSTQSTRDTQQADPKDGQADPKKPTKKRVYNRKKEV
jgi:hypothetical protein